MPIISITHNSERSIVLSRGLTDLLKFIASLMVAFGHYAGYALSYTDNPIYRFIVMFAGNVGVALFFFISGYGLMMSEQKRHLTLFQFIKRRLSKVYLPVVFVSFIWQLFLWPSNAGIERIPHLIYATLWGFSDGILWFVKAIMLCYVLFRIYIYFKNKVGREFIALLIGTIVVYALVFYYFADWCAIAIPMFTLGVIISDYNRLSFDTLKSKWIIIILLAITILYTILYVLLGNLYFKALFNWYVIILLLIICVFYRIDVKIPSWMGEISYDIYITHNKVINYLRPMCAYIGFWNFTLITAIVSSLVYILRKLFKI